MDDVARPDAEDCDDEDGASTPFSARELAMIAEAEEEIRTVGTIPAEEVHAWVESLFTPNPLPMPEPRKPA